jgi:hypothetical protein
LCRRNPWFCFRSIVRHPELALCRFDLAFARLDLLRIRIAPTQHTFQAMISHRKSAFARPAPAGRYGPPDFGPNDKLTFVPIEHVDRVTLAAERKLGFMPPATCTYASRRLAATYRLANLKTLKLRMIQVQRLILPCPTVRRPKRFRLGPGFKHSTVFPNRVRSKEGVIFSFRAFEKVKPYKTWHLSR